MAQAFNIDSKIEPLMDTDIGVLLTTLGKGHFPVSQIRTADTVHRKAFVKLVDRQPDLVR